MVERRSVWAATDRGRIRTTNEDRFCVGDYISNGADGEWSGALEVGRSWAFVADGMGGHDAGELASETAVRAIRETVFADMNSIEAAAMLHLANRRVREAMFIGSGRPAMGSTAVGVILRSGSATIVNVGDSRAYVFNGRSLTLHTVDDTLGRAMSDSGARSHALTQSLGGTIRPVPIKPHVKQIALGREEAILLCSDGLTDMVSEGAIVAILGERPDHPARALASAALRAGGRDNVTVIVVGASSAGGQSPSE